MYKLQRTMHIIKHWGNSLYYYIGIMFQLPQNEIYVDSRNWKTCLLLYALRDAYKSRDKQQLYDAKTIKLLHLF